MNPENLCTCYLNFSSYLTENTLLLNYKDKSIRVV